MKTYPLIFKFCNVVRKDGFASVVLTEGRAVLEERDEQWWISGVQPGGIAERGAAPVEVYQRFREAFQRVLGGIGDESHDRGAFEAKARDFFNDVDRPAANRWAAARAEIQAGAEVDLELTKVTNPPTPRIEILNLEESMPVTDDTHALAA